MKPETVLARLLLASVFLVVGGYRLWLAYRGAPLSNGTLVLSAAARLKRQVKQSAPALAHAKRLVAIARKAGLKRVSRP